jgi:hypothetical protein
VREVLADLRPNARMLAEMAATVGVSAEVRRAAGAVTPAWRRSHVLAPAKVSALDRTVTDIDDPRLRERLVRRHARLLAEYGMKHLDISEVRSRQRPVTQAIGRDLYESGAAGVRFRSNLDDQPCFAFFENRVAVEPAGAALGLEDDLPELVRVCGEYGLTLAPVR